MLEMNGSNESKLPNTYLEARDVRRIGKGFNGYVEIVE